MIHDFLYHQFTEFDHDSSGDLDMNEFIELTKSTYENFIPGGVDSNAKEILEMSARGKFEEIDLDKSGTIDFDEFKLGFMSTVLYTMN